jgi:hypothetical protein
MPKSARQESAFLNIPYDRNYEPLYLAFIAGLSAFGLVPHATIESNSPATPRFNMPFELGLAVDWALGANPKHEWFVFESRAHRLEKSLSDLNGTDPHVHDGTPHGVLRRLINALSRKVHDPNLTQLDAIFRDLSKAARKVKLEMRGGSLFEARPFKYLVFLAREMAEERISSLRA